MKQELIISEVTTLSQEINPDKIFLIQQFFISDNPERNIELKECLLRNVVLFDKIILLNERLYTVEELGVNSPKIQQYIIGHRLKVNDIFWATKLFDLKGYIVFGNLDIFFDESIFYLRRTALHKVRSIFCLTRFEYDGGPLSKCSLFGIHYQNKLVPNFTSQDVWIFHTNFLPLDIDIDHCFGILGVDNVIPDKFERAGYKIHNEPYLIRTYHNHSCQHRTYTVATRIQEDYLFIIPYVPPISK